MAYESILFETQGEIGIVTINRPQVLNAMSPAVAAELLDCFGKINGDEAIKVVVLTGTGKAFVAGADIAEMSQMTSLESRFFSHQLQELTLLMESMPQPIIAAVNGFALGGGTELSMACDFIYASDKAKFGQPEINLGVIPGAGGTQRLPRLVGKSWAKELCLTGEIIPADLAQQIGLVNRVFPAEELMDAVMKTAAAIAAKGRVATWLIKDAINLGLDMPLAHGLRFEAEAFATCFDSEDREEGMGAFLEKRRAKFKGGYK